MGSSIIKKGLIIGCCFLLLSFIVEESLVFSHLKTNNRSTPDIDYVIILGAGIKGKELSKTLKRRLDTSLAYLTEQKDLPVIVSGGQGPGEDIAEAEAMGDYLIQNGIAKERIVLEAKSTNTELNLRYSSEIISKLGLENPRIMIITSDYHMYRAKMIADRLGIEAYGISSQSPFFNRLKYMIREYFAVIKTTIQLYMEGK